MSKIINKIVIIVAIVLSALMIALVGRVDFLVYDQYSPYIIGLLLLAVPGVIYFITGAKFKPHIVTTYYVDVVLLYYIGIIFGVSQDYPFYEWIAGATLGFTIGLITIQYVSKHEGFKKFHPFTAYVFLFIVPMGIIGLWKVIEFYISSGLGLDLQNSIPIELGGHTPIDKVMYDMMFDIIFSLTGVLVLYGHIFFYRKGYEKYNFVQFYVNG